MSCGVTIEISTLLCRAHVLDPQLVRRDTLDAAQAKSVPISVALQIVQWVY